MISPVLKAEQVCMYFGGLKAVEKVDMSITKGDIFGIIGPNGAGKTTFFNVCSGINKPTSGRIYLDGEEVTGKSPEHIASLGLSRTFQNIMLFKYMTVLENIKIGFHLKLKTNLLDAVLHTPRYKREEAFTVEEGRKILDLVGLSEYADTMAGNLPYGIQRKVEIARALALDPKILLLDEPAAGMNPKETRELSDFIKEINALGYTVAVIEHDMRFVMGTCNRILVLNFGEKIAEGGPDEIRQDKAVREAYFGKGIAMGESAKC